MLQADERLQLIQPRVQHFGASNFAALSVHARFHLFAVSWLSLAVLILAFYTIARSGNNFNQDPAVPAQKLYLRDEKISVFHISDIHIEPFYDPSNFKSDEKTCRASAFDPAKCASLEWKVSPKHTSKNT
jgi:hypothetical protein